MPHPNHAVTIPLEQVSPNHAVTMPLEQVSLKLLC